MSSVPAELKYVDTHEWLRQEDDGTITIGIGLALMAWAPNVPIGVFAGSLLAVGMGMVSPSNSSLISREAAVNEQGGIMGVNQSVGSFARLAGPWTAGALFQSWGPGAPYLLGAAIMLVSTWLALLVVRQRRPPAPELAAIRP